jgi:TPR repeat protein
MVAALASFIFAAGCAFPTPRPSDVPGRSSASEGAPFQVWLPAECVGRVDCARVCIAGEVRRCVQAGMMWERDDATGSADLPRAAELHQRACLAGEPEGCRHVEAVIKRLSDGCEGGAADRCTDLGYVHEHGIGLFADLYNAVHFYEVACAADAPVACARLGGLYDDGRGVAPDWQRAARLYARACRGGVAAGCGGLGFLYEKGRGVGPPDEARARALYAEGCAGGSGMACANGEILAAREKDAKPAAPTRVPPPVTPPQKPLPPKPPPSPPASTCASEACSS